MATDNLTTIPGIVRNGVVVPQSDTTLREGTHVEIVIQPSGVPAELLAEIAAWDKASDEAWTMIDQLESEPQ
jgi:predicted DNA-binding antitoxin AbrB/MazE fold protein